MKKLLTLFFVCALPITSAFAEFVISPSFGYANIYSKATDTKNRDIGLVKGSVEITNKLNHHALVLGVDLGGYFRNGFGIFFNSNFALGGNIKYLTTAKFKVESGLGNVEKEAKIDLTLKYLKGVSWASQLLFGGTKKFSNNFNLSFFAGLSAGMDYFSVNKVEKNGNSVDLSGLSAKDHTSFSYYTVGVPLQLHLSYYFAKHFGVTFSIVELPSMTIGSKDELIEMPSLKKDESSSTKLGFQNMLYIKVGPSFKF